MQNALPRIYPVKLVRRVLHPVLRVVVCRSDQKFSVYFGNGRNIREFDFSGRFVLIAIFLGVNCENIGFNYSYRFNDYDFFWLFLIN